MTPKHHHTAKKTHIKKVRVKKAHPDHHAQSVKVRHEKVKATQVEKAAAEHQKRITATDLKKTKKDDSGVRAKSLKGFTGVS